MRIKVFALLLLPAALSAQVARDSVITVNATKVTRVAADRASFYIVVEGTAETAPDAVSRVETKLRAVTDALKGLGSRVESDKPFAYTVGATPNTNGYPGAAAPASNIARSVIRVQLKRADQAAQVIAAAIAAGAASTSGIAFESTVTDSVRRARIAETIATARGDAEAIASSLGGRLGALVDVSSTGGNTGFQQQAQLNFDNRFGLTQSFAPEVTVTTSVTVRFRLMR